MTLPSRSVGTVLQTMITTAALRKSMACNSTGGCPSQPPPGSRFSPSPLVTTPRPGPLRLTVSCSFLKIDLAFLTKTHGLTCD